jgi:ssRNA-specific RNase YbeY (16S rRNA maturation enzyme)
VNAEILYPKVSLQSDGQTNSTMTTSSSESAISFTVAGISIISCSNTDEQSLNLEFVQSRVHTNTISISTAVP